MKSFIVCDIDDSAFLRSDDPSAENVGHKWTLSALLRHLKAQGKDTGLLMSQVEDLVIKAMLASASSITAACKMFVAYASNCFGMKKYHHRAVQINNIIFSL